MGNRKFNGDDIDDVMENGIVFKGAPKNVNHKNGKVKTKARKKAYITGAHGSASAKHKASFRK